MQIEFLVNGGVSLLLCPDNEMEEALLKQMMKQQNDLIEIRSSVIVLNRTFRNGVLIGKKNSIHTDKLEDKTIIKVDVKEETL